MTRVCKKCGEEHPIENFPYYKEGSRRYTCSNCMKKYAHKRYEAYKDIQLPSNKAKRALMWEHIFILKGGRKCADCGLDIEGPVYDLHHRDPSVKEFTVGATARRWSKIVEQEVDKCDLLCSVCHRLRHWREEK